MLKNALPRFLPNPEKNWGPKSAARIKQTIDEDESLGQKEMSHDGKTANGLDKNTGKSQKSGKKIKFS